MIGKIGNQIGSRDKFIEDSKITTKNIYSKIAPPNTFKRRNTNQISKNPKIFQRYENTPQSNQISNPYINYNSNNNSNFSKRTSYISSNNTFISNADSNMKLSQNINSSFKEKIKIIKGNLFNNQNNNNNKIKLPIQYIAKNKSVYVKKDKNNFLKNIEEKENKKDEINKNIKDDININNDIDNIKEKYDFLLEKTRNLLSNYQKIIEFYQEKEKEKNNKIDDNS